MNDYTVIGEHELYRKGQEVQLSDKEAKQLLADKVIELTPKKAAK